MIAPSPMTLADLLDCYRLERDVSDVWCCKLTNILRKFELHLGRAPTLADLADDPVNRFVIAFRDQVSPRTCQNYRNGIIILWRFAVESGRMDELPRRVRVVRVPDHKPQAWNEDQLALILGVCKHLKGELIDGTPRALYFTALFQVAYHCGLRKGDLLRFDLNDRRGDTMLVVQSKTGKRHVFTLPTDVWEMLEELSRLPNRDRYPLVWPVTDCRFYYWTGKICKAAGVPRGALQRIRRTGASILARDDRTAATRYLGHKTLDLAERYYIDVTVSGERAPAPPIVIATPAAALPKIVDQRLQVSARAYPAADDIVGHLRQRKALDQSSAVTLASIVEGTGYSRDFLAHEVMPLLRQQRRVRGVRKVGYFLTVKGAAND